MQWWHLINPSICIHVRIHVVSGISDKMYFIEVFRVKEQLSSLEILRLLGCVRKARKWFTLTWCSVSVNESTYVLKCHPESFAWVSVWAYLIGVSKEREHKRAFCNSIKPGDIIVIIIWPIFLLCFACFHGAKDIVNDVAEWKLDQCGLFRLYRKWDYQKFFTIM